MGPIDPGTAAMHLCGTAEDGRRRSMLYKVRYGAGGSRQYAARVGQRRSMLHNVNTCLRRRLTATTAGWRCASRRSPSRRIQPEMWRDDRHAAQHSWAASAPASSVCWRMPFIRRLSWIRATRSSYSNKGGRFTFGFGLTYLGKTHVCSSL